MMHFCGERVHGGEPFTWELATAVDALGQRRLLLQDGATYPEPLFNLLQYRAIGECRDALLQHAAVRLGQALPSSNSSLRTVVTGVLTALGLRRAQSRPR